MEMQKREKKEVAETSFEGEMRSLEESLQRLRGGWVIDYEKQIQKVENQLSAMEAKYEKDEKIVKFVRRVGNKVSTIGVIMGGIVALLTEHKATGIGVAAAGLSLEIIADDVGSKLQKRALKAREDIQILINESRNFTDTYLQKGGAEYVEGGRLEVTKKQVEKARRDGK